MICIERESLEQLLDAAVGLRREIAAFLATRPKAGPHAGRLAEFDSSRKRFRRGLNRFRGHVDTAAIEGTAAMDKVYADAGPGALVELFTPFVDAARDLARQAEQLYRTATALIETCEIECGARSSDDWNPREVNRIRKAADEARRQGVEQLGRVRYFWSQARWLTERFPDGELRDVPGLVKLVDRAEIEANDWRASRPAATSASPPRRRTRTSTSRPPCARSTRSSKNSTPRRPCSRRRSARTSRSSGYEDTNRCEDRRCR